MARISKAREEFLALRDDMNRGLVARAKIEGLDEALEKARALRAELTQAAGALGGIAGRGAVPGSTIGQQAMAERSPWAGGARPGSALGAGAQPARGAASARRASAKPGGKEDEDPTLNLGKSLKYVAKQAGIGRAALAAMGTAATLELTKLALGYRGMAMLQALGMRAQLQLRQLFRGVDPAPIIRAFDRLTQLVNGNTAAGKALSTLFSHVFNGLFGLIERAEPILSSMFEGAILGALELHTAWLKLRIALVPLQVAIERATGKTFELGDAATLVERPFKTIAGWVELVAHRIQQATQLWGRFNEAMGGAPNAIVKKTVGVVGSAVVDPVGFGKRIGYDAATSVKRAFRGPEMPEGPISVPLDTGPAPGGPKAAAARKAGNATGQAYADGMVAGVNAGTPAVGAAGQALAGALDQGVRTKGKIRSPSKLAEDTAYQYPRGTVRGVERGLPEVKAAGEKLFPKMAGGAGAGGKGSGPVSSIFVTIKHEWSGERPANARGYEAAAEAGDLLALRSLAEQLGVSVQLAGSA